MKNAQLYTTAMISWLVAIHTCTLFVEAWNIVKIRLPSFHQKHTRKSFLEMKKSSSSYGSNKVMNADINNPTNISEKERFRRTKKIMKVPIMIVKKRRQLVEQRRKNKERYGGKKVIVERMEESLPESIDFEDSNHSIIPTNLTSRKYNAVSTSPLNQVTKNLKSEERERKRKRKKEANEIARVITNTEELRKAVLDENIPLQDLDFDVSCFRSSAKKERLSKDISRAETLTTSMKTEQNMVQIDDKDGHLDLPFNHEVIELIEKRFKTKSKPGSREHDDSAHLSLSIEGGGMRGAVSAGMASAIAVLGLSDCFDSIYGSSAGSVIGAYMVSRQMCIDVYTELLTTAKSRFVSKTRLASSLAFNLLDQAMNNTIFSKNLNPAMNISFVLDSIMNPENGLRPLDMEMFQLNDKKQQLRIVTSCVRGGKMETHCLGSQNMDFFDLVHNETNIVLERATTMKNGKRHGLFACLETSMTVPAATGPPLPLLRHKDRESNMTTKCFDAFCYEPIPYRSAVEEGATHVLVLKSRPEGNPIGTTPGLFEKVFAPMYFDGNNMPQVSTYFEKGGQQYIYVEDYLTLDEAKKAGRNGVKVPPRKILYGVEKDEEIISLMQNRDKWKEAHLLPISVPSGTPELSTLSVDTIEVLEAVQNGFAAAFDLLAPSTGIKLNSHLNGERVAKLIFSTNTTKNKNDILQQPIPIAGDPIGGGQIVEHQKEMEISISELMLNNTFTDFAAPSSRKRNPNDKNHEYNKPCPKQDSLHLIEKLPGINKGKMISLSYGLYHHISKDGEEF